METKMELKIGPVMIRNLMLQDIFYEPGEAMLLKLKHQDSIDNRIYVGFLSLDKQESNELIEVLKKEGLF